MSHITIKYAINNNCIEKSIVYLELHKFQKKQYHLLLQICPGYIWNWLYLGGCMAIFEIISYANVNGTLNYKNALVKMCPIISCFDEGSILFTIDTAFITAVRFLSSPMKYP